MSKSKSVSIDTKKSRITFICFVAVFILVVFVIPIVHVAADGINWNGLSYEVGRTVEANSKIKNGLRYTEYNTLKFMCMAIDEFDNGLTTLLNLNLYDFIKKEFNITSIVYPVAWALASLALIIAAVMLIINADKMRLSDFFRNLLVSIMLLIALPTLVSQFSSLRKSGVKSVKSSFSEDLIVTEETIISNPTLGQNLLASYITDTKMSVKNNELFKYNSPKNAVFKNDPSRVYSIPINRTITDDSYDRKWSDTGDLERAPSFVQKKYSDLTLVEKIKLLDDEFARTTALSGGKSTILSTYEYWSNSNKDDHFIQDSGQGFVYSKVGGAVVASNSDMDRDDGENIWCRFGPTGGWDDGLLYVPNSQIFEGDAVYIDADLKKTTKAIPFLSKWERIDENNFSQFGYKSQEDAMEDLRWGSFWQYDSYPAFNYISIINNQMLQYAKTLVNSDNIPDEFKTDAFSSDWVEANLINNSPQSIEELIRRIEDNKVYLEYYGTNFSIIEYLNMEENYRNIIENKKSDGVASFEKILTKEAQEAAKKDEPFTAALNAMLYVDGYEGIYYYNLDFLPALTLIVVTLICMCFSMVKIVRLLFDILFAQIVAPLVVASDLNGSGRAKQVVQNLISCNIVMIAVVFILRLYIYVLISAQDKNYPFTVMIALTVGGAMFVIDGPDLVVKILGVDAGVKSGAAAIMSIRSATQIAGSAVSNTSRTVGNIVKKGNTTAAAVAGGIAGVHSGMKSGADFGRNIVQNVATNSDGSYKNVGGKILSNTFSGIGSAFGGIGGGIVGAGKGYMTGENEARNSQGAVSTAVHGVKGVYTAATSNSSIGHSSNHTSSNAGSASTPTIGRTETSNTNTVTTEKNNSGNSNLAASKGDKGEMGINGVNGHNGNDGKNGIDGINGQNNVNTTSNNTANIGNAFNKPTNNIANEPTNQQVYNDLNK